MKRLALMALMVSLAGCGIFGAASGPSETVQETAKVISVKQCVAGPTCDVLIEFADGKTQESITTFSQVNAGDIWVRNCRYYPTTGAKYCEKYWYRQ